MKKRFTDFYHVQWGSTDDFRVASCTNPDYVSVESLKQLYRLACALRRKWLLLKLIYIQFVLNINQNMIDIIAIMMHSMLRCATLHIIRLLVTSLNDASFPTASSPSICIHLVGITYTRAGNLWCPHPIGQSKWNRTDEFSIICKYTMNRLLKDRPSLHALLRMGLWKCICLDLWRLAIPVVALVRQSPTHCIRAESSEPEFKWLYRVNNWMRVVKLGRWIKIR